MHFTRPSGSGWLTRNRFFGKKCPRTCCNYIFYHFTNMGPGSNGRRRYKPTVLHTMNVHEEALDMRSLVFNPRPPIKPTMK